jgi:nicotinamidase-related amidase
MENIFIPEKEVEVPELEFKEKISLPKNKTAVVIVDMQNDFVKEGGNLLIPDAVKSIKNINTLLDKARDDGVHVAYTQDTHTENDKEFKIWPKHCIEGSWGWHIVDELKPKDEDLVIQKNRYDGFYGSNLEHYLTHVWDVENLVIMGTVANICVAHTAASAGLRWYYIVVPAEGISAANQFDQAMTLRQVSTLYAGDTVKSVNDIIFE